MTLRIDRRLEKQENQEGCGIQGSMQSICPLYAFMLHQISTTYTEISIKDQHTSAHIDSHEVAVPDQENPVTHLPNHKYVPSSDQQDACSKAMKPPTQRSLPLRVSASC